MGDERDDDVWMLIADVHAHDGGPPLNRVEGLWRRKLPDGWEVAVNGHREQTDFVFDDGSKFPLEPYNGIAVHGEMPLLHFGPPGTGGIAIGHGSEDAFVAALKKAAGERRS